MKHLKLISLYQTTTVDCTRVTNLTAWTSLPVSPRTLNESNYIHHSVANSDSLKNKQHLQFLTLTLINLERLYEDSSPLSLKIQN